jgi:predicted secreted Zn-dependent protease
MTFLRYAIFGITISILASTPTNARDTSAVAFYPVDGKSPYEVLRYIKTKSPRVARNATFAFTLIATKTAKKTQESASGCSYKLFKTSALYGFNLPQHKNLTAMPKRDRTNWQAFVTYLLNHEEGHRTIWQRCFLSYDAEALALKANTCDALDEAREARFTKIKRQCVGEDEAYDVVFRKEVLLHPFMRKAGAPSESD